MTDKEMDTGADKNVRQLTTLMELSALLNSTLDQKVVRRRAMEAATRLMECEVGSLLLVDEERGDLFFEVARRAPLCRACFFGRGYI